MESSLSRSYYKKGKSQTKPRRKKIDGLRFSAYIFRVLKQVHPDTGITKNAMTAIQGIENEWLSKIVQLAIRLHKDTQKKETLSSREIQTAVRLLFPTEFAKHAVSEGTKAVTKYTGSAYLSSSYIGTRSSNKENKDPKPKMSGGRGKGKKTTKSRSERAGLEFPVGRISSYMKKAFNVKRLGAGAPVYLAGVLEYIAAEILELAGNAAKDNKVQRITPRHLVLAIRMDEELNTIVKGVVAKGGVLPLIQPALIPKNSKSGKSSAAKKSSAKKTTSRRKTKRSTPTTSNAESAAQSSEEENTEYYEDSFSSFF